MEEDGNDILDGRSMSWHGRQEKSIPETGIIFLWFQVLIDTDLMIWCKNILGR